MFIVPSVLLLAGVDADARGWPWAAAPAQAIRVDHAGSAVKDHGGLRLIACIGVPLPASARNFSRALPRSAWFRPACCGVALAA
jgi:hypothetical protein